MPAYDADPLHYAVLLHRADLVEEALESGLDVNSRARGGMTALMVAAQNGYEDLAELLIKAGADINARQIASSSGDGKLTALHIAAERNYLSICRLLLENGANPNALSQDGYTPLNVAVLERNSALVILLLEGGADPNGPERSDEPPIVTAARENDLPILQELLRRGADPNRIGRNGDSALEMTISIECAQTLLRHGADIKRTNHQGNTVLISHIQVASPELVRCYIDAGVDVNARDNEGNTALMLLTHEPRIEVAELLIAAGADVNALWRSNVSVLDYIAGDRGGLAGRRVRRKDLVEFLRNKGAKTAKELGVKTVGAETESIDLERSVPIPEFQSRAAAPEFKAALEELEGRVRSPARPWEGVAGGYHFEVGKERGRELVEELHEKMYPRGCFVFHTTGGLGAFPTHDAYEVIAAVGTSAPNYEMDTRQIIRRLKEMAAKHSFRLVGVGHDYLEGCFLRRIESPSQLAKWMYKFCPDIVDQGTGTVAALAEDIQKSQRFFLWWD